MSWLNGLVKCDRCNGSGALECKFCDGDGVLREGFPIDIVIPDEPCPRCDGGFIDCPECQGTGEVKEEEEE